MDSSWRRLAVMIGLAVGGSALLPPPPPATEATGPLLAAAQAAPGPAAAPFAVTTTTRQPATAALPTATAPAATTEPPRTRLVVSGAGDTNVDPNYIPAFRTHGYEHAFSGLGDIFANDDLTIVNLECAASPLGAPVKDKFNFNCDVNALPVVRAAGVDVANLANNHGADFGEEALLDTKANIAAAGLAPVGVGANASEAHQPAIFELNGWTIAVLGFNGVVPWADWIATDDDPGMADGNDVETMVAAVEAADLLADLVFVTVHWGVELDLGPRADDVERARAMIDAGADGIFGHHPHRLQPLEMYEGKPIAWSLGNFVWPRLSLAGATSAIAQFVVEPDGTFGACLVPVVIESDGHPVVQVDHRGPCDWADPAGQPQPG
jgi:poly-gamma-glutamate synthesis protein (capsule biosynthesis protein)